MQTAKESVRVLHSLLTRRKRFTHTPGVAGLDIAYITDRVMVCSFPFDLPLFFSRNNAGELLKFLEATHKDNYKVYNLCAERKYDPGKFKGRVAEYAVHVNEAPQLYTIYSFIKDMNMWLDADPMNVVCIHCDNGRDRTGMMVSAWLLQTKRCLTASHAITFFASVRGGISPCVTIPSQRRYVEYVERVLTEKMPAIKLVVLEKITIYTVPMFNLRGGCSPWFSISKLNKSIFYSKSLEGKKGKMSIDFHCNFIQLQGDIVIAFFDGKFSRLMFRISFHSSFIRGKTVTFYPRDIDGPHADVNNKNFNSEFKVTLHFASVALLPAEQISPDDVVPQSKKYTFEDILNISTLCEAFRAYLLEYRCSENIDFWKNVQRYKAFYLPSAAKSIATKIHSKFILSHAPDEVNISHEARQDVEAGIAVDAPSPNLFALAEKEIYSLMKNDSYPRFIISDLFFKACSDLSDYANNTPGALPQPANPNLRAYANTSPHSAIAEKQPLSKRFVTHSASEGSASFPPSNGVYEYVSPFKLIDEKLSQKEQESSRRPASPEATSKEAIKRKDGPKKDNPASRADLLNPELTKPRAGSGGKNMPQPLATAPRKNSAEFLLKMKPRREGSPRKDQAPLSHESPRKDNAPPVHELPRKEPLTRLEKMEVKRAFATSVKAISPVPFTSPMSSMSSMSSHSRSHYIEGDKRHDFIKGDYRSAKLGQDATHDPPSSHLHLDLSSTTSLRLSSDGFDEDCVPPEATSSQNSRILYANNKAISSPQLPSYGANTPSAPRPEVPPSSTSSPSPSPTSCDVSTQITPPQAPASRLSKRQSILSPKAKVTWEEPQNSPSESPPSTQFTFDPPDPRNHPASPAPSALRSPSSPAAGLTADSTALHLAKKNVSHQMQSHLPPPSSRPTSASLVHSASAPSIVFPAPQGPTEDADSPNTSPTSSFIQFGDVRRHSGTSTSKFSRLPPPPRPETPSGYSPSVLSFERMAPHEALQTTSSVPPTPSTYPSTEQSDALKVMDNVKLVCVECREQIGNKDVVVSFMHHYYHWGCVRCFRCHQPLSSDCVISGDKPYCGKCNDDFFNKCTACGLSITETAEEQRVDPDDCWHRRCFSCSVCGVTSNSERPIEQYPADYKLYCVFHHPEPRDVPVVSAQDSRDTQDDTSDYSLNPYDWSDSDESPQASPSPSPPPSPPLTSRSQAPKPLPTPPSSPSKMQSSPKLPPKPLPATPLSPTLTSNMKPKQPVPTLTLTPTLPPASTPTTSPTPSALTPRTSPTLTTTTSSTLTPTPRISPTLTPTTIPPTLTPATSSTLTPTPASSPSTSTDDNAMPHRSKEHKPLPPTPARRPTLVSALAPFPISNQTTTPSTVTTTSPVSIPTSSSSSIPTTPRSFLTLDSSYFPGSCAACSGRIPKSGQLLLAGGVQYHPTCFACSVCASPITGSYQEHEGAVFCPEHPVVTHARRMRCAACDGPIEPGKYLMVGADDKYHMECFGCKLCGLHFGTEHSYYDLWGGHICLSCYDTSWRLKNKSRGYK